MTNYKDDTMTLTQLHEHSRVLKDAAKNCHDVLERVEVGPPVCPTSRCLVKYISRVQTAHFPVFSSLTFLVYNPETGVFDFKDNGSLALDSDTDHPNHPTPASDDKFNDFSLNWLLPIWQAYLISSNSTAEECTLSDFLVKSGYMFLDLVHAAGPNKKRGCLYNGRTQQELSLADYEAVHAACDKYNDAIIKAVIDHQRSLTDTPKNYGQIRVMSLCMGINNTIYDKTMIRVKKWMADSPGFITSVNEEPLPAMCMFLFFG